MAQFGDKKDEGKTPEEKSAKARGAAVSEPAERKAHIPPSKASQPYHGGLVDEGVAVLVELSGDKKISEDQAKAIFIGLVEDQLARRVVFRNVETAKR